MMLNKKIKKKERKVPNYKVNYGWSGQDPNNKKTWLIRTIETKEILEYFRTKQTAKLALPFLEKKVYVKCEVVFNEKL